LPGGPSDEQSSELLTLELSAWLGASHIVSLHLPLLPQTHHLIGGMRPSAYLINMSRGNIKEKFGLEDATSLIRFAVRWGESEKPTA